MGAIEVNGLRKAFPNGVEAVAGIDLTVEHGEIFGFLGPNGAGKSTTTRMLTTLLRPTAGGARVGGLDILKQSAQVRRIIGVAVVAQDMECCGVHASLMASHEATECVSVSLSCTVEVRILVSHLRAL